MCVRLQTKVKARLLIEHTDNTKVDDDYVPASGKLQLAPSRHWPSSMRQAHHASPFAEAATTPSQRSSHAVPRSIPFAFFSFLAPLFPTPSSVYALQLSGRKVLVILFTCTFSVTLRQACDSRYASLGPYMETLLPLMQTKLHPTSFISFWSLIQCNATTEKCAYACSTTPRFAAR